MGLQDQSVLVADCCGDLQSECLMCLNKGKREFEMLRRMAMCLKVKATGRVRGQLRWTDDVKRGLFEGNFGAERSSG